MKKIEVHLKDKNDFTSRYNENRISSDLYTYIKKEVKLADIKDKINIEISTDFKLTDKEKEQLSLNIKKTSEEEINDIKYIEEKVLLLELLFLFIGFIIIFLYFLIKNIAIISEIVLIIGWLLIWEALDRLIFSRTENKIKKQRLKQIIKSDIDFID